MNLFEVRVHVVDLSGRYDLITDTTSYGNMGIDFFINSASRYLDLHTNQEVLKKLFITTLDDENPEFIIENAHSLLEYDNDALVDIQVTYAKGGGKSFIFKRSNGVKKVDLRIYARAGEKSLIEPDDINFWSAAYPDALILATLTMIERYNRNTAGVADYLVQLDSEIENIDATFLETLIANKNSLPYLHYLND